MNELRNILIADANKANRKAKTKMGVVTSYSADKYMVKVQLQPDDINTGWIPLKALWVGNGWGIYMPPSISDMVEVDFLEDDEGVASCAWRYFNDEEVPASCPSGEFWIVHKSQSLLKFHNDGTVEVTSPSTINYTAALHHFAGPVQMDNTLNVNQNITGKQDIVATNNVADAGGTKTMSGMRTVYNSHNHSDPQGGTVGQPNQGM